MELKDSIEGQAFSLESIGGMSTNQRHAQYKEDKCESYMPHM